MFKLVISDDEGKTTSVPLVRDEITIGRKEGNTIRLTDRNVSRRHARLQKQSGHYLLHDLGSYNGIVINGVRLNEARPLKHGDQVLIGDYKLAILEESTSQIAIPPPPSNNGMEPAETLPEVPVAPRPSSTAPGIPSAMASAAQVNGAAPIAPAAMPPAPPPPAPPPAAAPGRISAPPMPPPSSAATAALVAPEPTAELSHLRLVFLAPNGVPAPIVLDRLPMVLGRSEAADIALPFPSISREHARLVVENGQLVIEDLGSQNGLSVNGTKTGRSVLTPGDLITLGVVECRVARRGDSTVLLHREPERKRSPAPVIFGVLGGGVALGLLAFIALRGSGGTSPTVASGGAGTTVAQPAQGAPVMPQPVPMLPLAQPGAPAANNVVAQAPGQAAVPPPTPQQEPGTGDPPTQPGQTEAAMNPHPPAVAMTNTAPAPRESSGHEPRSGRSTHERPSHSGGSEVASNTPPPSSGGSGSSSANTVAAPRVNPPATTPSNGSSGTSSASSGLSALDQARQCLRNSDNACAVEALRGHASTEPELALLAITYRTMGNQSEAIRSMQRYLSRFPSGPRSESFRNYIDEHQ